MRLAILILLLLSSQGCSTNSKTSSENSESFNQCSRQIEFLLDDEANKCGFDPFGLCKSRIKKLSKLKCSVGMLVEDGLYSELCYKIKGEIIREVNVGGSVLEEATPVNTEPDCKTPEKYTAAYSFRSKDDCNRFQLNCTEGRLKGAPTVACFGSSRDCLSLEEIAKNNTRKEDNGQDPSYSFEYSAYGHPTLEKCENNFKKDNCVKGGMNLGEGKWEDCFMWKGHAVPDSTIPNNCLQMSDVKTSKRRYEMKQRVINRELKARNDKCNNLKTNDIAAYEAAVVAGWCE